MKNLQIACLLLIIGVTLGSTLSQTQVPLKVVQAFTKWVQLHGKIYLTPAEKDYRLRIFHQNLIKVETHNSDSTKTYTSGMTVFGDLTHDEYLAKLSYLKSNLKKSENQAPLKSASNLSQVTNFDWRNYLQTQVINIGTGCNSNYAWISAVTMNGNYGIKYGSTPAFSPQTYIDCSGNFGNYGCQGGYSANCYTYSYSYGIDTLSNYPYRGAQNPCTSRVGIYKNVGSYAVQSLSNTDLYNRLSAKNIITVAIDISGAQFYSGGIFTGPCSTTVNQGLILVGAGISNNQMYWTMLNTWGSNWGENGFMRIARFTVDNNPQYSSCGLNMYGTMPYF